MRKLVPLFLSAALGVALSVAGWAQTTDTFVFRTLLSPANEVPPVTNVDASATAIIWVHVVRDSRGNITSGTVDFRVDYRFPGDVEIVGLHIHPAPAGVNGPVAISSGISGGITAPTGTIFRQVVVSSSDTAAFNAMIGVLNQPDQHYANIHTRANPAGVLRGQLFPADVVVVRGVMSPANEVPPIAGLDGSASASVTAYATRDSNGTVTSGSVLFDVSYRFPGEATITGLHIHPSPAGANGPVVISSGVATFTDSTGSGNITRWAEVTPTNRAGLDALDGLYRNPDQFYINIHTSVNPGGAMRSQLQRTDTIVLRAGMSPANEVPPVTGLAASALSKVTLHVNRDSAGQITSGTAVFDVSFDFPSAAEFVGLHIHQGAAGINGPVIISSGISGSNSVTTDGRGNILRSVDVAATNTAGVDALRGLLANPDNWYINLLTTVNPGGVIRAQETLPGEPETRITLDPGYYVAEVTVASDQPAGVWGMVALASGALSGGFNLGGGFGGNGIPGFGAFVLNEPKTVTLSLAAQALPGQPGPQVAMRLLSGGDEVRGAGSATTTRTLLPGFHVVEIRSLAGVGTFQLMISTDTLRDGGIAGGYVAPGLTGFGAFDLGSRQTVNLRLFARSFYSPYGAGNLTLTVKDFATGAVRARAQ